MFSNVWQKRLRGLRTGTSRKARQRKTARPALLQCEALENRLALAALTAHWALDESGSAVIAEESIGNQDGTLQNFVVSPWVAGQVNNGLDFDGVNDHLTHDVTLPRNTGTLSHWLNPDLVRTNMIAYYESGGTASVLFNGFGDPNSQLEINSGLSIEAGNHPLWHFLYQDGTGNGGSDGRLNIFSTSDVATGVWTHVVATWDTAGDLVLYVNGTPEATLPMSGKSFANLPATVHQIGRVGDGTTNRHWDGSVDDVGIWSGALPAAEVRALWSLASNISLSYDADQTQQLFDLHQAGSGATTIGGRQWSFRNDLTSPLGEATELGDEFFLRLDADGSGVATTLDEIPLFVSNTSDSGPGSLRQAILDANTVVGADVIAFNIGGGGVQTISLAAALPVVTDPLTIDGTTQPGFAGSPIIELSGAGAGSTASGLVITAGNSTVRGLVINRFGSTGIELTTSGGNVLEGNYIGTDVSGTLRLGNGVYGVNLFQSHSNRIGTNGDGLNDAAERNIISANGIFGVQVLQSNDNIVAGNFVGTDVTGTANLGNGKYGVLIFGGHFNRVGTNGDGLEDSAERNLVAGSGDPLDPWLDGVGVGIASSTLNDTATHNVVAGNYIGTDVTGTLAIPNVGGVRLGQGAQDNFVGTRADGFASAATRNVISGNSNAGVMLFDPDDYAPGDDRGLPGAERNVIAGNFIGVDATGAAALANVGDGVQITAGTEIQGMPTRGVRHNRIGTDADGVNDAAERNIISGNTKNGVLIDGIGGDENLVSGNWIGIDASGAPLGNQSNGVRISGWAQNNVIGSAGAAANVIAFNQGAGVMVTDAGVDFYPELDPIHEFVSNGPSIQNRIQGNSIHSNRGLGIDLDGNGATANDTGDGDSGPNNLQNYPILVAAYPGAAARVVGLLQGSPNASFTLDFYASSTADPSWHGEGQRYLGSGSVTTDGAGLASFNISTLTATSSGEVISATSTDLAGNTSEFCEALLSVAGTPANDAIIFSAHASGGVEAFVNGVSHGAARKVFVSDPDGSDSYTVNFGVWAGSVTIDDTGIGTDVLTTSGTPGPDVIVKVDNQVTWGSPVEETVNFNGIESVTIEGAAGDDTITDPGTDTTILGGLGDDTIVIDATYGNGVVVDGGEGSDTYMVRFGSLAGPVTLADSGATGVDSLVVLGTIGDDAITLTGNEVLNGTERVILAALVANLTVDAGDGSDTMIVSDFTAPISSLTLDGGAGTNQVSVEGDLPPGVTLDVVAATQAVQIHVLRDTLNLANSGVIAVAIFTTANFNAALVDASTVFFAGAHAVHSAMEDVDGDGVLDMVLHFRTQDTNLRTLYEQLVAEDINSDDELDSNHQLAEVTLTGQTVDDVFLEGFAELDLFLSGNSLRKLLDELAAAGVI